MPRTHHTLRCATVPYPWQIQENLKDVLDVDVPLLASIEHQMLEVLHWRLPMGRVYQTYADAIFDAAGAALGVPRPVPQVLHEWEEPKERPPAAYRDAATAIQRAWRAIPA